jgi:four helix bundle protein
MAFRSFEELDVWKRACQLAVCVYQSTSDSKDFALRDQMRRAAISIASNIAEGAERTPKDFCRFLVIARGSAAELRTQAYIAVRVGQITAQQMGHVVEETKGIAKMLVGLARSVNTGKKDDRRKAARPEN